MGPHMGLSGIMKDAPDSVTRRLISILTVEHAMSNITTVSYVTACSFFAYDSAMTEGLRLVSCLLNRLLPIDFQPEYRHGNEVSKTCYDVCEVVCVGSRSSA